MRRAETSKAQVCLTVQKYNNFQRTAKKTSDVCGAEGVHPYKNVQAVPHVMQKTSCSTCHAKTMQNTSCSTCCKNHAKNKLFHMLQKNMQKPCKMRRVRSANPPNPHSPRVPCYMCYMCYISQGKPLNIHSPRIPCYMCYMCYMALYSAYTTDFRAYRIYSTYSTYSKELGESGGFSGLACKI